VPYDRYVANTKITKPKTHGFFASFVTFVTFVAFVFVRCRAIMTAHDSVG
jgi:hypothetical protein